MTGREGFVKTIQVNSKKRPLYEESYLKQKFETAVAKEGNNAFHTKNGFLRVSHMRTVYTTLFSHMATAAYHKFGVLNPSLLCNEWGFYTTGTMSPGQATEHLKKHVFTKKAVQEAYEDNSAVSLLGAARNHLNPLVRRSYDLFSKNKREGFEQSVRSLANSFYPDLEKKYGRKLFLEELTEEEIVANLGQRFVEKRNVLHRRDLDPVSLHVDQTIRSLDIPGEIPFDSTVDGKKKSYFGSISSRQLKYLQKNPGLERLRLVDIAPRTQEGRSLIGKLAENESKLFFYLLRDNPEILARSGLEEFIGTNIHKVFTNADRKKVSINSKFDGVVEADLRLEVSKGEPKDILIDTKRYDELPREELEKIIVHYSGAKFFLDGRQIGKKIILLNSRTQNEPEIIAELAKYGITTIPGDVFNQAYKIALEYLPEDFFMNTTMPLAGSLSQQIGKLQRVHDFVFEKPYVLARNGNNFYLGWALQLYSSILDRFTHPNKRVFDRAAFMNLPTERIFDFREFGDEYVGFTEDHYKNLAKYASNVLFLDLETAGVVRSGNPLHTIGLAYVKNGVPLIHQLFARDPAEEAFAINRFKEIADTKDLIVDFNGLSFDQPFLEERFYAHCMPYEFRKKHLDLLPFWRAFNHLLPDSRLQTYEQMILDAHLRIGDIKGDKIADAWKAAVFGGLTGKVWKSLSHNLFDMKTLAALFIDLLVNGALNKTLPQEFVIDDVVMGLDEGEVDDLPF